MKLNKKLQDIIKILDIIERAKDELILNLSEKDKNKLSKYFYKKQAEIMGNSLKAKLNADIFSKPRKQKRR